MKKKNRQLALVLALVAVIAMAGTFAWSNFSQSRVNIFRDLMTPDVNLHDDFQGGPNKDVYVENSGRQDIFVRVKLTEYLQTTGLGSLVLGHTADQESLWVPHNTVQAVSEGATTYDLNQCDIEASGNQVNPQWTNAAGQDFHDFYTWTLGGQEGGNANGQIYYKPAPEELRAQVDEDGNVVQEAQVVSDENTGLYGDAAAYYAQQMANVADEDKAAKMEELGIKQTLTAKVYTMDQWKNGIKTNEADENYVLAPYAQGDYWVIDTDGWAYWANPLHGGEATGLLLDRVDRTANKFDSDAEYKINVQLQAVTADDIAEFGTERGGGISKDALRMLRVASGTGVIGKDANGDEILFVKNADGTYTPTDPDTGEVTDATAKYIFLTGEHSIQEGKALKIGDNLSFTELEWDGTDYANFDEAQGEAPMYNLSKVAEAGENTYQLTGAQTGVDGRTYLILTDASGEQAYAGAVVRGGEDGNYTYTQTDPGKGLFAFIYPTVTDSAGNALIGTDRDLRIDPNVTIYNRTFRLLGNGVYEETTETALAALAGDSPAKTFFFAGRYVTKSMFSGVNESNVTEKVNAVFPLRLTEGGWFTFGVNNSETGYTQVIGYGTDGVTSETTGAVQFETLEQGADGNYYIKLAGKKNGYIGPNDDGFLSAPSGGTTSDKRAWANPATGLPIGSVGANGDVFTRPGDFTESFLKGLTSEDLSTTGTTFSADGYDWLVVGADEYGNRLIMSKTYWYRNGLEKSPKGGSDDMNTGWPAYNSSKWPAAAQAALSGLPTLKNYAMRAETPSAVYGEYASGKNNSYVYHKDVKADLDSSSAVYRESGDGTAFVPSIGDYYTYGGIMGVDDDSVANNSGKAALRTALSKAGYIRSYMAATSTSSYMYLKAAGENYFFAQSIDRYNCAPNLAMWVRFSDADEIATATADELAAWKATGKAMAQNAAMTVGQYKYQIMAVQDGKAKLMVTVAESVTFEAGKTAITNWWNGLSGEDAEIKSHAYMPEGDMGDIEFTDNMGETPATDTRPRDGECPAFVPLYGDFIAVGDSQDIKNRWSRSVLNGRYLYTNGSPQTADPDTKLNMATCLWVDWSWAAKYLD